MGKNSNNTNGNKGNNSNKNPSTPKGAQCAADGAFGRERKKAAAKAQASAKASLRAIETVRNLREIDTAFAEAGTSMGKLAQGLYGTYGIKENDGIVVIRITAYNGKPVACVDFSTVPGIVACDRKHVPVATFRQVELQMVIPAIFEWQVKVHALLRKYVTPFFVTRVEGLGEKWRNENPTSLAEVKASAMVPVTEEVLVDVSGAIPMTAVAFMGVKQGHSRLYVEKDGNGNEAYYRAERVAGNQAMTLVVADEGHALYRAFASQAAKVRIHLSDLSAETRPYDGDLKDMKDARECLRQYLRAIGASLGVKAKRSVEVETEVMTPAVSSM